MKFTYATNYVRLRSALPHWQLANNTVIIRAELNVPLNQGTILDDQKCKALQPTLDLLLEKKAKIIVLTHLGRPKAQEQELSTKQLLSWFKKQGYSIEYAATVDKINSLLKQSSIVLFENVRFFDKQDQQMATQLFQLSSHYVMDAFGSIHRDDFSLTTLAQLFPPDKRTIGLLVEKELHALAPLILKPARPFVVILGGGKVADKLPLLIQFATYVDQLLLCPAISNTFAQAQGLPIGNSLVDDESIPAINQFLAGAHKARLHMPTDYITSPIKDGDPKNLQFCSAQNVPSTNTIITVGSKTVAHYTTVIQMAKTIFFNGLSGFLDKPDTLISARQLMTAMAQSNAYTVIGGGDSVAAAHQFGLANKIDFLSTGGGATLALLADQELPALDLYSI